MQPIWDLRLQINNELIVFTRSRYIVIRPYRQNTGVDGKADNISGGRSSSDRQRNLHSIHVLTWIHIHKAELSPLLNPSDN